MIALGYTAAIGLPPAILILAVTLPACRSTTFTTLVSAKVKLSYRPAQH
ncbi:hypothetical protein [Nocardia grenadensis]